jgi:uncharacterized membrane protein
MTILLLGLVLFLGVHSVRIFADDWRTRQIAARGEAAWKGVYALLALAGLVLIVVGYGQARAEPTVLWIPPLWTRHLAALLTLPAFILLFAAYVPGTHIKARLGHPMLLGTKLWAFAHLIANGTLADVLLFGGFLAWAIVLFAKSRRRDRAAGTVYAAAGASRDVMAVIAGAGAWAAFAVMLHTLLIGVAPFGG